MSDSSSQAVELEIEGPRLTLRAIAEWRGGTLDPPMSVAHRLTSFITANSVPAERIAVTVDTAALFTHILPVPADQSPALLLSHGRWELAQFFPEHVESDFITDVHLLGSNADTTHHRALCVAVRRDVSRSLQQALQAEGLELHVLDGDQFSAEHWLTTRHPDGRKGTLVLAGLKEDRVDFSILRDGTLIEYAAWSDPSPEACAAWIAERQSQHGEVQRVYIYGRRATPRAAESLGTMIHRTVELLDPFADMTLALRNPVAEHFLSAPHRFLPAVGVALREE